MASLNKVTLLGNCGDNPRISNTQSGNKIANFSLATSESWKDKEGNKQSRVEWHRVVIFSKGLVNVAEKYLKKGSKVYIEGQLQTRKWEDNGVEKYTTEIVLQNFNSNLILLDNKPNDDNSGNFEDISQEETDYCIENDIPF